LVNYIIFLGCKFNAVVMACFSRSGNTCQIFWIVLV